jgi:hypothetical protein
MTPTEKTQLMERTILELTLENQTLKETIESLEKDKSMYWKWFSAKDDEFKKLQLSISENEKTLVAITGTKTELS